jgi:serine/threonine protein kinase
VRIRLLQYVAKAIVKHSARFFVSLVPGGEVLYEIAADVWADYQHDQEFGALRADIEALAQALPGDVFQASAAAVQETTDHTPAIRDDLVAYLSQLPTAIRRSLRRSSDLTGTTVPPNLVLDGPESLMAFLPRRRPRFKPGDRPLAGVDWELEELVGVGGFGEVWKARNPHLASADPVALKFCLDPAAAKVLRNEAAVLDRVMHHGKHRGIVQLLRTYLSADTPCLEYEFVNGGDLAALIQDFHRRKRMRLKTANEILVALAKIVAFAHRATPPIVHQDLKPANVLIRRLPDGKLALRVTDFGIGGIAAAQAQIDTKQSVSSRQGLLPEVVRGAYTPLYASPQQMTRRAGELPDPRDDDTPWV